MTGTMPSPSVAVRKFPGAPREARRRTSAAGAARRGVRAECDTVTAAAPSPATPARRPAPDPPCPAQTEPSSLAWLGLVCLGATHAKLPAPLLLTLARPIGFKQSAPKFRKPLRNCTLNFLPAVF